MSGPLPAVANAIYDACGVRIPDAPFTAEKILMAMHDKDGGEISR